MSDTDSCDGGVYSFIPKKKCSQIRGCTDLFRYLKQNQRTFVAAITFVTALTCVILIGAAYSNSIHFHSNTCYFTAGIAGILSNVYGFAHFRTLYMNQKKEVDVYSTNNKKEVNQFSESDTLVTTAKLFDDIDSRLNTYRSLKREYKQESAKIKSFLQANDAQTTTIKDLQISIDNITNIQHSITEWLNDFSSIDNSNCSSPTNAELNIRPFEGNTTQKQTRSCRGSFFESDEMTEMEANRSFGTLFSKQFQIKISKDYKESIQQNEEISEPSQQTKQMKVVQFFHDNIYGQNEIFETAFGKRPVIYCDWTASGKPLQCVERYLETEMYTLYANTHTTTSITGIQTSKFRSEARSIILHSLSGDGDQDCVIFCGSGVTGAIYKMSRILMLGQSYRPQSTIVFISVYEHNSNIYIWKELGCKLLVIPENNNHQKGTYTGGIDLKYLEKKLKVYTSAHMKNKYNLLIGSFSAASNVSGIIAPVEQTTLLLHKYGALSFWDYAAAAPYLDVNMTNINSPMLSKDAVFISVHKYLAGPGAPGILCAKSKLFQNYVPVVPGGGTVFAAFGVEDGQWQYLNNIVEKEEGGTPDIIGSVRAAFAFMVKDHLSTQFIEETEKKYLHFFLHEIKSLENLVMMGNTECERLPVFSFCVTHSKAQFTKYLHHNFIAALFNDLFGIQGRGGCACAGMYGLFALGLKDDEVEYVLNQMRQNKNELARPGYFRINLHYTITENELKYIVNAVKYVCHNGWKFLPLYDVDKETGNYFHRDIKRKPHLLKKQLRSLLDISFNESDGKMEWIQKHMKVEGKALNDNLDKFFILADEILHNLKQYLPSKDEFKSEDSINDENAWYWLPSELYQQVVNSIEQ